MLSVLRQSYSNLQAFYIFDNASGKDTKDIVNNLSKNDDRVKYHCHSNKYWRTRKF